MQDESTLESLLTRVLSRATLALSTASLLLTGAYHIRLMLLAGCSELESTIREAGGAVNMKTPGARAFGECAQGIFLVGRQLQPLRHHEVHALLASLACAAVEVQASCVCVVCARAVCRRMCVPPRNEMCGAAPDDVCVVHQQCARCGMHRDVIECGTPSSVPRCVLVSRTSSSRSSGEKKPHSNSLK